jgi:hypothetical protein
MPQVRLPKSPKTERISPQAVEEPQEPQEVPNPIRITAIVVSHNRADLLRRAIAVDALPASWRDYFQERVELLARSA